ncbi:MAG: TrkH family potassium uptake protein [Planctomycetota bacterium]|nr:TrkH family potassium uptake protein [Planctomycetota bacterium]
MNWLLLARVLGLLCMLVGGSMVFSLPWAFPVFGETPEFETRGFWGIVAAIGCSLVIGGGLYLLGRREQGTILRKEALAIVGLSWILAGVLGGLPFVFSETHSAPGERMTPADALFESVSGFTTTGASVLTELEDARTSARDESHMESPLGEHKAALEQPQVGQKLIPRCVLFWRCFTHWLGGMGIIVLVVAVLGQLGAGGKALMRREVPGPINETVRPRVRETAVVMWGIYMGVSVLLTVILILEGMSAFDAMCHTFGTMATGGFSTYNASVGHFSNGSYNGPLIETTLIVFMIAAGTNFSLYYLVLRGGDRKTGSRRGLRRFGPLVGDPEYRVYLAILALATLALTITLRTHGIYDSIIDAFRHAGFTVVSIMTTTGFGTIDFHEWHQSAKGLLLLLMFVGGCAGSTGGGIKVIRFILFLKILSLEVERAYRPNVVRKLKVGNATIDDGQRHEVLVYFSLVLFIFISSWMVLATIEPNTQWQEKGHTEAEKLLDCASAVAATLNNIGPGVGVLGPHSNYSQFSTQGKLLLTLLMLLGRLELFAMLVLFSRSFWKSQ